MPRHSRTSTICRRHGGRVPGGECFLAERIRRAGQRCGPTGTPRAGGLSVAIVRSSTRTTRRSVRLCPRRPFAGDRGLLPANPNYFVLGQKRLIVIDAIRRMAVPDGGEIPGELRRWLGESGPDRWNNRKIREHRSNRPFINDRSVSAASLSAALSGVRRPSRRVPRTITRYPHPGNRAYDPPREAA